MAGQSLVARPSLDSIFSSSGTAVATPNSRPGLDEIFSGSSKKYYKPLFTQPDISTSQHPYQTAALNTAKEGIAIPAMRGVNTLLAGLPQAGLNKIGLTIPEPTTTQGKALTFGADVAGFIGGPGGLAKKGIEAMPFLRTAANAPGIVRGGMSALRGGLETAGAFGMMQPEGTLGPAIHERLDEAKKGAILGTALPILGEVASKFGKPAAAWAQKVLTGYIPVDEAKAVIDEPHKITKTWLNNQYAKATNLWKIYVQPKIENSANKVNLHTLNQELNHSQVDIPVLSGEPITLKVQGKPTGKYVSMTPSEASHYEEIVKDVNNHQGVGTADSMSFRGAQNIMNKIDRFLSPSYDTAKKAFSNDSGVKSSIFETVMKSIRGQILESVALDQPEAANALKEMREYYKWQGRANMYKGTNMTFFKALAPRLLLIAGLGMKAPVAGLVAGLGTMPMAWGGAIKAGSELGKIPFEGLTGVAKEIADISSEATKHSLKNRMN